jgi:hypothetical protein
MDIYDSIFAKVCDMADEFDWKDLGEDARDIWIQEEMHRRLQKIKVENLKADTPDIDSIAERNNENWRS